MYVAEMGQHYDKLMQSGKRYEVRSVIQSAIARLVENGIRKKMFHPVDSQITAKAMIGLLETLIFETSETVKKEEVTANFQKAEKLFLEGLLASEQNQK